MANTTAYLVVTSVTIPGKMPQMHQYHSKVMPLLIKGGGEPVARYGVLEQLGGEGGPQGIAILKFPNAEAIKAVLASADFKALASLRDQAFSRVDQLLCAAL